MTDLSQQPDIDHDLVQLKGSPEAETGIKNYDDVGALLESWRSSQQQPQVAVNLTLCFRPTMLVGAAVHMAMYSLIQHLTERRWKLSAHFHRFALKF